MWTIHNARLTTVTELQTSRASGQPMSSASGTVPRAVTSDPTFSVAEYAAVATAVRSAGRSRRMITGTTTFPIVIAAPMMNMPASIEP